MNNNQTLEIQIKSTAEQAKDSINKLINSLSKMNSSVQRASTKIDKDGKTISSTFTAIEKKGKNLYTTIQRLDKDGNIKNVTQNVKKLDSQVGIVQSSFSKLNKVLSISALSIGVTKLTTTFLEWMNLAVDRTEQLNLFNVVFKNVEKNGVKTFSTLGQEATKFQNTLNESFGTNMTETMKYQGLYQSMAENVGISDVHSALMSETMTKLTYDLASLYNKSESDVAEALRAGVYAGQTKPLRSYGIDVTQQSLQPILDELGIDDRSVKQMSQAEKEILRYIATLRQATVAMGDYANTIESPSNQQKVFKQQLIESKVALTSLFIGGFSQILPYANAFLMVVKEVAEALADMFGIELVDFNSGIASNEEAFEDLSDSIGNASDSVKELKRQVLGFDQIHNINEDKDNDSGNGNLVGGIDKRLLDSITGYDNGMDKVKMKATEIRDRIMEWLGFTKEINPLTGEVFFKLKNGETRFSKILDWIDKIKKVGSWIFEHLKQIVEVYLAVKLISKLSKIKTMLSSLNIPAPLASLLGKTGTITITLAIGITAGAALYDFINALMGNDKTFSGTWSETSNLWNSMDKSRESSTNARENRATELSNIIKTYGKDSKEYLDYMIYLQKVYDQGIFKDFGLSARIANYKNDYDGQYEEIIKMADEYSNLKGRFNLFDESSGTNITEYADQFKKLTSNITSSIPSISNYKAIIEESDSSIKNATNSMQLLINQINTGNYEEAIESLSEMKGYIDSIKTSMEQTANANYDMTTQIIANLQAQGIIVKEEAEAMQTTANEMKSEALKNAEEYSAKIEELNEKLKAGKITNQEYAVAVQELNQKYNPAIKITDKFANTIQKTSNITTKNWKQMQEGIEQMSSSYDESLAEIKKSNDEYVDAIAEMMTEAEAKYGKNSEQYKYYSELMMYQNELNEKSVEDLNKTYGTQLLNIVRSIYSSGQIATEEGREQVNNINKELNKLGYNVDEVTEENFRSMLKNYQSLATDITDETSELSDEFGTLYTEMGWKAGQNLYKEILTAESNIKKISPTVNVKGKYEDFVSNIQSKLKNKNVSIDVIANVVALTKDSIKNLEIGNFGWIKKADGGLFSNGTWKNITQYANGGLPSAGEMFIAREAGPELVGSIGGRTAVMNNNQIVDSVAFGVYQAVISAMSQTGGNQIEIYAHTDEGVVIDRINQKTKQTGVCPITIPSY